MIKKRKWDLTLESVAFSECGTVAARVFRGKKTQQQHFFFKREFMTGYPYANRNGL